MSDVILAVGYDEMVLSTFNDDHVPYILLPC